MIDHVGIRQKLRERLLTVDALPDPEQFIAWENRAFKPPLQVPPQLWIRETYNPGSERGSANTILELTALINYDVFYPSAAGSEEPEELAKDIGDAFRPFQGLIVTNLTQISLLRAERGKGRLSTGEGNLVWWMVPVTITLRAFAPVAA